VVGGRKRAKQRVRKYRRKLEDWQGLQVIHTGYKQACYPAIDEYVRAAPFFELCDYLASLLCIQNNLSVVDCERVFRFMRECCREYLRTGEACYEAIRECKGRFKGWVKCDEIGEWVKYLSKHLGCSSVSGVFLKAVVDVGAGYKSPLPINVITDYVIRMTPYFASVSGRASRDYGFPAYGSLSGRASRAYESARVGALSVRASIIAVKVSL